MKLVRGEDERLMCCVVQDHRRGQDAVDQGRRRGWQHDYGGHHRCARHPRGRRPRGQGDQEDRRGRAERRDRL